MSFTMSQATIDEVRAVAREQQTGLRSNEAEAKVDCPCCGSHLTLGVSGTGVKPAAERALFVRAVASEREGTTWRAPS